MLQVMPELLAAVPNALYLVATSVSIGFCLAIIVAIGQLSKNRIFSRVAYYYVFVFRATPLLVQIFLIYFGSGQFHHQLEAVGLWTFFRDPWFCAIFALSLNTAAYTGEIIRGGIVSIDKGQREAAEAVGMDGLDVFRFVIFPQAMRQALPAYGNEVILMVKATSLASTITILEITGAATRLQAETFQPLEVYGAAGLIYLGLNMLLIQFVRAAEKMLNKDRQQTVSGSTQTKA